MKGLIFSVAQHTHSGLGRLVIEVSGSHANRHTVLGRTLLHEGSARCRDLYLTTHNTHKGQISMFPAGFEPAIPASERLQTYNLDPVNTGIGGQGPHYVII
jgi:hypothetical protein